jgi:3-phosphoshikimate 1-carboxyvinyltransferase
VIEIRVPASKSITQRALLLAALGDRRCGVSAALDCDDSRAMARGLEQLGARVETGEHRWTVAPLRVPIVAAGPALDLGNAGTAVRFLTGLSLLLAGRFSIDGDPAMRRRPLPNLLAALRGAGVEVEERGRPGCPPLSLARAVGASKAKAPPRRLRLQAGGSSQELSALLLAGCRAPGGLEVWVDGELPSQPYVELTVAVMREFGIAIERPAPDLYRVPEALPDRDEFAVEPDWTSASYPLAAAWLTDRRVELPGIRERSVQGDRVFAELLDRLNRPGVRRIDLGATPDLAPALIACALFAEGETTITGAAHLRIKESDRIGVPARELGKLGAEIEERQDGLRVRPVPLRGPAALDPAGDHRMAMAFGLVALRVDGVRVENQGCVSKSYPGYWEMLERFR